MAESETLSLIIMGSKYKKELEREWEGRSCADVKIKTLQIQADRNVSKIMAGSFKRIKRRSRKL